MHHLKRVFLFTAVFLFLAVILGRNQLVYESFADEKPGKSAIHKEGGAERQAGSMKSSEAESSANKSAGQEAAKTSEDDDDDDDEQGIMDDALALLDESQEYWKKGDIENALELLDQAYSLILDTDGDPAIARQKDDVRLLISKRILSIYNSMHTATKGKAGEIPLVMNADVEYEIRLFQTREKEFFIGSYKRSGLYRPAIVKELKKAGLPEELSWLPLVESGFKISAMSPARALGLWQFIPSTGYKYGMSRDEWIDERMDVDKSTRAAIGYMKDLHGMFGDWLTVLASYNCGEGRVLRVISRQHLNYLDNFWDLYRQLPRETARYVPRFLATLHIIKDPKKYGMDLGDPKEKPVTYEIVKSKKSMKLQDIAERLSIPEETMTFLNPELRHKATPDRDYDLKIPTEMGEKFVAVVNDIPVFEKPRSVDVSRRGVIRHRVRRGETVASIARKYGTSVGAIREYNRLSAGKGVATGQRVVVPVRGRRLAASPTSDKNVSMRPQQGGKQVQYRVKKGDTLIVLSKRFNVTVPELKKMNGLKSNALKTGQVIRVGYQAAETPAEVKGKKKIVRKKVVSKRPVKKETD